MQITQDVREYAASLGLGEKHALERGLEEKSEQFKQAGSQLYVLPSAGTAHK
jgi:phosphomethylpyrimidine synthase